MRVTTSDGSFGFLVESTDSPKFFVFQLVIDAQVLGDREPCILGTAMQQLQDLPTVSIDASPGNETLASGLLSELQANDESSDATLLPLAESLDALQLRGFINGSTVTFLAQQGGATEQSTSPILTSIPVPEYDAIVAAIVTYWTAADTQRL